MRAKPKPVAAHVTLDSGNQRIREGSGTCLQDNRAVGNSRLAHTDVLSVSCKQVPEPDRRHGLFREKDSI